MQNVKTILRYGKTILKERGGAMVIDFKKLQIQCARQNVNMTDVLKAAHISTLTMQRIKAGNEVQPRTAGKLATALKIDVVEIMKD